jgi:hypothetical protein
LDRRTGNALDLTADIVTRLERLADFLRLDQFFGDLLLIAIHFKPDDFDIENRATARIVDGNVGWRRGSNARTVYSSDNLSPRRLRPNTILQCRGIDAL